MIEPSATPSVNEKARTGGDGGGAASATRAGGWQERRAGSADTSASLWRGGSVTNGGLGLCRRRRSRLVHRLVRGNAGGWSGSVRPRGRSPPRGSPAPLNTVLDREFERA